MLRMTVTEFTKAPKYPFTKMCVHCTLYTFTHMCTAINFTHKYHMPPLKLWLYGSLFGSNFASFFFIIIMTGQP